jgi:predicted aconitase
LVGGAAEGEVELCHIDVAIARIEPDTGVLREPGHPLDGHCLAGKVLACRGGKGSSSGSYVLLNLARRQLAPAAILVERADAVLIAGAVLANIPLMQDVNLSAFVPGREVLVSGTTRSEQNASLAERMLRAVAKANKADLMIPVASAHVGLSLSSLGEAGVELLESLAQQGVRFAVPTTTNVMSFERTESDNAEAMLQRRALDALVAMGAHANCSCNPVSQGFAPRCGQAVAWSESATAPYVNGVLGARTNREGATALASAIAGVTPRYGMHLDRYRKGGARYRVTARLQSMERFHILAAVIGRHGDTGVPVLEGLMPPVSPEWLYGFSASLASHSSAAMFHIVGMTPEAPDLMSVFPNGVPEAVEVSDRDLEREQERWATDISLPDYVIIGCPHASFKQVREVARMLDGARVRAETKFLVHTSLDVKQAARASGDFAVLERAGAHLTADTCIYVSLARYAVGTSLLTDSAKMAYLMSTRGLRTAIRSTAECVRAALV